MTSKRPKITDSMKLYVLKQYNAKVSCAICTNDMFIGIVEYDHAVPLHLAGERGHTTESLHTPENLRPTCVPCHASKSGREVHMMAKVDRIRKRLLGIQKAKKKIPSRKFQKRVKT